MKLPKFLIKLNRYFNDVCPECGIPEQEYGYYGYTRCVNPKCVKGAKYVTR